MTAIDRQQIIEDAARTLKAHDADRMECLSDHKLCCPAGDHDFTDRYLHEASVALPVIVAAVLKPIRDLHSRHVRTEYDDPECEDSACDHYDELEDRWWCPGHPVWICRACDQGADGRVLAPCPTVRLCDEIEAAAKGGE